MGPVKYLHLPESPGARLSLLQRLQAIAVRSPVSCQVTAIYCKHFLTNDTCGPSPAGGRLRGWGQGVL